jgi:hypothetical protein
MNDAGRTTCFTATWTGLGLNLTLRGEKPLGLHDDDNIIIIIVITLVPLSRHVNKHIDHHHHVAQNNFKMCSEEFRM